MAHDPQHVMVLAWYSKEQWKLLKRSAADAHLLDDTYDEWLEQMNRQARRLKQEGNAIIKCFVDIAELESWCQNEDVSLDAKARSQYVAQLARDRKLEPE
jgi:hypothetical protein